MSQYLRWPTGFSVFAFVAITLLVSVLIWLLYPDQSANDRWQGKCDVELIVQVIGLPADAEIAVVLHRGFGETVSLGTTNASGWTSAVVDFSCGPYRGSESQIAVHYGLDEIELIDSRRGISLGRVPLEAALGRTWDVVVERPHRRPVPIVVMMIEEPVE